MGFTVTGKNGTKDAEFETYARLLRQRGADLGRLPRIRDPISGKRWLYVWDTKPEAEAFAEELRQRTGDGAWEVVPVGAPASEGPFGPLFIQLGRQGDGLTFELHPLSRALIRSAFPDAFGVTYVFVDTQTWSEIREAGHDIQDLTGERVAPALTGLTAEHLQGVGYAVIDADTEETYVFVPPAIPAHG